MRTWISPAFSLQHDFTSWCLFSAFCGDKYSLFCALNASVVGEQVLASLKLCTALRIDPGGSNCTNFTWPSRGWRSPQSAQQIHLWGWRAGWANTAELCPFWQVRQKHDRGNSSKVAVCSSFCRVLKENWDDVKAQIRSCVFQIDQKLSWCKVVGKAARVVKRFCMTRVLCTVLYLIIQGQREISYLHVEHL